MSLLELLQERGGMSLYGPVPPVWQSAQFTCVRSPISTGCWNDALGTGTAVAAPSASDIIVWH